MIDVKVSKPSSYGLMFIHDELLCYALGFIKYRIKHERVYASYRHCFAREKILNINRISKIQTILLINFLISTYSNGIFMNSPHSMIYVFRRYKKQIIFQSYWGTPFNNCQRFQTRKILHHIYLAHE